MWSTYLSFDTAPGCREAQAVFYVTRESVTRPPCLSSVESARSMRDPCLVVVLVRVCRHSLSETAALKTAVLVADHTNPALPPTKRRCPQQWHPRERRRGHSRERLLLRELPQDEGVGRYLSSLMMRGSAET